ncbi:hypothetical protein [Palleronia marisminoris]|nr:hypothetical protein [Palleronia marisminoris]
MKRFLSAIPTAILLAASNQVFAAESYGKAPESTAFVFGGALTADDMQRSASPLAVDYDGNGIIGAGLQSFYFDLDWVRVGGEVGLAFRFGQSSTSEVWAGPVARLDPLKLGNDLRITPSITVGLSMVSDAQVGREADQEREYEGNASLLFYLGPEISVSFREDAPSIFWRLHHRSGAGKTLGNMKGATNANVIGVRYIF